MRTIHFVAFEKICNNSKYISLEIVCSWNIPCAVGVEKVVIASRAPKPGSVWEIQSVASRINGLPVRRLREEPRIFATRRHLNHLRPRKSKVHCGILWLFFFLSLFAAWVRWDLLNPILLQIPPPISKKARALFQKPPCHSSLFKAITPLTDQPQTIKELLCVYFLTTALKIALPIL